MMKKCIGLNGEGERIVNRIDGVLMSDDIFFVC